MSAAVAITLMLAKITDPYILCQVDDPAFPKASAPGDPCKKYQEKSDIERVGKGPHILVISEVNGGMTKVSYASGPACIHARDEVRRQIGGVRLGVLRPALTGL